MQMATSPDNELPVIILNFYGTVNFSLFAFCIGLYSSAISSPPPHFYGVVSAIACSFLHDLGKSAWSRIRLSISGYSTRSTRVSSHRDHILTRGGIAAEFHSTTWKKLIVTILDYMEGKIKRPDDKLKSGSKATSILSHFFFCYCFFLKKECKTIKAKVIAN